VVHEKEAPVSLKECRECGHQVPDGETVCPSCGAAFSLRSRIVKVGFLALALVATAIVYVGMFQPGSVRRKSGPPVAPVDALQSQADQLLAGGSVTKFERHAIWVEPGLWRLRSDDERRAIASVFGIQAGMNDGSRKSWCVVRDNQTGKVLAEWSEASGLKAVAPDDARNR
jgi:hypothetical protein